MHQERKRRELDSNKVMIMINETWDMNEQSKHTQNGMVYYDYQDGLWKRMNDNYHQVVSMLVKLVKTFIPLCLKVPEWYPTEKRDEKFREKDECDEVLNNERIKNNNKYEREWITPNNTIRVVNKENRKLSNLN